MITAVVLTLSSGFVLAQAPGRGPCSGGGVEEEANTYRLGV